MTKKAVAETFAKMAEKGIAYDDETALAWLAINLSKIESKMSQSNFIDSKFQKEKKNSGIGNVLRGRMFFFGYLPKTRNDLSFWDEFPIAIVLSRNPKSMLALNLHYLNPVERQTLLSRLFYFVSDENWMKNRNENAFFDMTYQIIKQRAGLSFYKKCIKRYYFSNVVTKMLYINPLEWQAVPFFPLDRFKGMGREQIWRLGIQQGKTNNR